MEDARCISREVRYAGVILALRRILQVEDAPLRGVGSGGTRAVGDTIEHATGAGNVNREVVLESYRLVDSVVAEIACRQKVIRNLPLYGQIPLIDISLFQARGKRAVAGLRKRHIRADGKRERISSGIAQIRIVDTTDRIGNADTEGIGRVVQSTSIPFKIPIVKKQSIGGSDHHETIALRIVSQP